MTTTRLSRSLCLAAIAALCTWGPTLAQDRPASDGLDQTFAAVEKRHDTRLGAVVIDTGSDRQWTHRADERFPMASTFKVFACAALLDAHEAGKLDAERTVAIEASDLVTYSPVTETRLETGVSPKQACADTMRTSDNTAANIVLEALGGPQAVTAFLRSIGDDTTRLDRTETALNEATPGDPRDTTTPAAAAESLRALVLGDAVSPDARGQLTHWLVANEVGGPLLRAGLPDDWRVGDRTGAGGHGTRGVLAVLWPPEGAPVVAAVYLTGREMPMEERNTAIATIGRAIAQTLQP